MVRKSFRVMVCFDLHQVSCPGVWLCPKGKIFITLSLFKCLETTKQVKPFFPLKYHQRFVFDKIFDSLSSLGELENEMGMRNIRMELVQVFKGKQKLVTLGVFQAPLTNVLYPDVAAGSDSGAAEVDLLFEACKPFPGIIAPKAEVSTRVVIEELRLCPKFTDGPVNPTLISSSIKCGMAKLRQSSVCHHKGNKQCKCNCCCSSGRVVSRRPCTSGDNQSTSKSRRYSTIPHQDIIEGGDDNNSESNGDQNDNNNQTTDNKTRDYDQNNHIYDQSNYQENIKRRNEEEYVIREDIQEDESDNDEYQRNYRNDRQRNDNQQQRGTDNISQSLYDNRQQRGYDNQYEIQRQRNDNQQQRLHDNTSQTEYDNRQQREYNNKNGKQRKNNQFERQNERNDKTPIQNMNNRDEQRSYTQYNHGNTGRNNQGLNRNSLNSQNGIRKQKVTADVHVDATDDSSNEQIEPRHSREISEHRSRGNQQINSRQNSNSPNEINQRSATTGNQGVQINRSTDNSKNTCDCSMECATCKKTIESLMVPWKVYAAPPFYNHYCNHNQRQNMDNPQDRNSGSNQNQPNINTTNQNGQSFNNHHNHQQNIINNDHNEDNHQQNMINNDRNENNRQQNVNNSNEHGNNQPRYNQNYSHHQKNSNNNQNRNYHQNLNIDQNNADFNQIPPQNRSTTTQTSGPCRCQERDKFSANVEKQKEKRTNNKLPSTPQIKGGGGDIVEKNSKFNQQQLKTNHQSKIQNQMMNRQTNPIVKGLNNPNGDQQINPKEDEKQCQVMEVRFICPCGHIGSSILPQKEAINRGSVHLRNIQTSSIGIPTRNNRNTINKNSKSLSGIPTLRKPIGRINTKSVKNQNDEEVIKHYPKNYVTCICPKPKSIKLRTEC